METILLIHASPSITGQIKTQLEQEGFKTLIANTKKQAFEVFNRRPFVLVIVGSKIYVRADFSDLISGDDLIDQLLEIEAFSYARMAMEPEDIREHPGVFIHDLSNSNAELVEKVKNYFLKA